MAKTKEKFSLQPYLYGVIQQLIREKDEAHKFPSYAVDFDIQRVVSSHISEILECMVEDGVLGVKHNVNLRKMYYLKADENKKAL